MVISRRIALLLCLATAPILAGAQARFDLTGPKIDIHVTRSGVSLPIASVPNLQSGDEIWLHPDFPPDQSAHYLLIVAFLRGTTNPPPDDWFTRIQTWDRRVREEGVSVTVPKDAQQAVLFLAPETGGDFGTLRSAVKGRPGIFVRATQDLTEAGFEQARIDKYLEEMKKVTPGDNAAVVEHSNLLARTLNLKPNPDCMKRPLDQQYNCLTQTGTQTLLDDGHGQSIVAALSNGPGSDFINQASYTGLAGGGNYSAYVGAIVDFVRIVSGLHTAKYQYIPAIAAPDADSLNLRLNTPPSFNNPKSVIVISLPAVLPSIKPPLRPVDPKHISCLLDPHMVLPIEGAPLVFSTSFAHDLVLHLNIPPIGDKPATTQDIPLIPDAFQGGLAIDPHPPIRHELPLDPHAEKPVPVPNLGTGTAQSSQPASPPKVTTIALDTALPGAPIEATIQGMWGFDSFTGPTLAVQQLPGRDWHIVTSPATPDTLIAGQPNHLQLTSTGTACIQSIDLEPSNTRVDWKLASDAKPANDKSDKSESSYKPTPTPSATPEVEPVDLTINLQHAATPGSIHLAIAQFGESRHDEVGTRTFSQPAKIDALQLHAGDTTAVLTGTSLNQVKTVTFKDLTYIPHCPAAAPDTPCPDSDSTLNIALPADAKAPGLKPNEKLSAQVHLEDGRTLDISTIVLPPRPAVTILSSRALLPSTSPIQLSSPADIPLGSQLQFFLKSKTNFPRNEQIEIANLDDSLHTSLSVAAGSLILQDSHTVLATFDPLKTFGPSTFGPFRLRAVDASGTPGEWQPLTTIVRLPTLTDVHCPAPLPPASPTAQAPVTSAPQTCQLNGSALYLLDAVSADPSFTNSTPVPEGYVDPSLAVPRPTPPQPAPSSTAASSPTDTLYLRLRDDPSAPHQVTLPLTTDAPLPSPAKQKNSHATPTIAPVATTIPPSL